MSDMGLAQFVETYHTPVRRLLASIHRRGDRKQEDIRYLILDLQRAPGSYVQCAFSDGDSWLMCAAASGFYSAVDEAERIKFPAATTEAVARLGISTDTSQDNFQRIVDIDGPETFGVVADLLLSALYAGYGARLGDAIRVEAPLCPEFGGLLRPLEY